MHGRRNVRAFIHKVVGSQGFASRNKIFNNCTKVTALTNCTMGSRSWEPGLCPLQSYLPKRLDENIRSHKLFRPMKNSLDWWMNICIYTYGILSTSLEFRNIYHIYEGISHSECHFWHCDSCTRISNLHCAESRMRVQLLEWETLFRTVNLRKLTQITSKVKVYLPMKEIADNRMRVKLAGCGKYDNRNIIAFILLI